MIDHCCGMFICIQSQHNYYYNHSYKSIARLKIVSKSLMIITNQIITLWTHTLYFVCVCIGVCIGVCVDKCNTFESTSYSYSSLLFAHISNRWYIERNHYGIFGILCLKNWSWWPLMARRQFTNWGLTL